LSVLLRFTDSDCPFFICKRLKNIGGDLGGAIKGFKKSMKESESDKIDNKDDNSSSILAISMSLWRNNTKV
jgi:Sec-independent protein translocase protein TatA